MRVILATLRLEIEGSYDYKVLENFHNTEECYHANEVINYQMSHSVPFSTVSPKLTPFTYSGNVVLHIEPERIRSKSPEDMRQ